MSITLILEKCFSLTFKMSRYRKVLTQEEIDAVLFNDTDESDMDIEANEKKRNFFMVLK